jgi:hypothetical protein
MRILLSSILAAATMAYAAMPLPASAASHPRVQPTSCGALIARMGSSRVWQAEFKGQRGGDGWDPYETIFVTPCFDNQATCVDWLYWAQSDWPDHEQPGRCRQGMPYSG